MTESASFKGVWTAIITPFESSGEIDWSAYDRILEDQKSSGVAGVVVCGTTGESPALSKDEKKKLITRAIETLKGSSCRVIAGTGSNNTAESVEFSRWASEAGAHALLMVTPYYNKPTQAGLERHFTMIADAITCPMMLYNVPGRTSVGLSAQTVARLAQHPRIRAIKEATGNVAFTSEIRDALIEAGTAMEVLSGDDVTFLPLLSVGGIGVVSVSSNLFPRGMVEIQKLFDAGKHHEAAELHQKFFPLFRDLFIETNPGPIKEAMAEAGWCKPLVRPPLAQLSEASKKTVLASYERCGRPR